MKKNVQIAVIDAYEVLKHRNIYHGAWFSEELQRRKKEIGANWRYLPCYEW